MHGSWSADGITIKKRTSPAFEVNDPVWNSSQKYNRPARQRVLGHLGMSTSKLKIADEKSDVEISLAPVAALDTVDHLTYRTLRPAVASQPEAKLAIARDGDFPCALAIGVPGPNCDFELVSIYVLPLYRRRGLGQRILARLERAFAEEGVRIGAHFVTVDPADQGLLHFLCKAGWGQPKVTGIICQSNLTVAFDTAWFVNARLAPRYRIVPWHTVSANARTTIEAGLGQWVPADLNPYLFEKGSELSNSLALLDSEEGDRVKGWAITHQTSPDMLRWTCTFVDPAIQRTCTVLPLWLACARRQRENSTAHRFMFAVDLNQPRMARFVVKRMGPRLDSLGYACTVLKTFDGNGVADLRKLA